MNSGSLFAGAFFGIVGAVFVVLATNAAPSQPRSLIRNAVPASVATSAAAASQPVVGRRAMYSVALIDGASPANAGRIRVRPASIE